MSYHKPLGRLINDVDSYYHRIPLRVRLTATETFYSHEVTSMVFEIPRKSPLTHSSTITSPTWLLGRVTMCLPAYSKAVRTLRLALTNGEDASNFSTLQHLHTFTVLPTFGTRKFHASESLSIFQLSRRRSG